MPPVGCSNVAIGQILATIRQPVAPPSTNLSTDWDRLRSISNSNNLSDYLPGQSSYNFESDDIQMRKVEELADFLYTIYVLNSAYTNENGTFSNIYAALNTLKSLSSTYFANATIREYSLTSTPLINCMKNNRPVYCRGEYTKGNNSYGHAWVVDGYAKRERDITVVTQCGYMEPEVRVRRQSAYFFHVNWGYSGLYDGYYYTGIFDMSGRQGFNSQIDTNPDTSNGTTSYSQNVKYISY